MLTATTKNHKWHTKLFEFLSELVSNSNGKDKVITTLQKEVCYLNRVATDGQGEQKVVRDRNGGQGEF